MQDKVDCLWFDHDRNQACVCVSISQNDNLVASGSTDGTLVVRSIKDDAVIIKDR